MPCEEFDHPDPNQGRSECHCRSEGSHAEPRGDRNERVPVCLSKPGFGKLTRGHGFSKDITGGASELPVEELLAIGGSHGIRIVECLTEDPERFRLVFFSPW